MTMAKISIHCIFNMSLLTVKLQLGLPYKNVWINWSSSWDKIYSLIFLISAKRVCLGVWKLGQWRKKCVIVSVTSAQSHNGFRVSWKQCLNLCLRRWLRLIRNLILAVWFHKNTICTRSYKVYEIFFNNWKTSLVSNFRIKFIPLKYSRKEEWVLEIIISYINFINVIAMFGCYVSVQVRNQIE